MTNVMMRQYVKLTEFLGMVLGPDFEVVLHDVSDPENSIIAIANGQISGRTIGAPLTEMARQTLSEKTYEEDAYRLNYSGIAVENETMLRSSTFYIKDETDALVGFLCINFDDSRHRDLIDQLLKLRHPDSYVDTNFVYNKEKVRAEANPAVVAERMHESVSLVTENVIARFVGESGIPVDRLTLDEKMDIIAILEEKGVFLLKNAVRLVARQLHCSQASVYRYLGKLNRKENKT